jgi:ferritin-like metal-binding protein YciE
MKTRRQSNESNQSNARREQSGSSLREVFIEELRDLYDAEKQLTKALPKMAKAAENDELRAAFESHLEETKEHVSRLERVFEIFGEAAKSKTCRGMQGLITEAEELIDEEEGDAALICGAQKAEHYEIAAYGSLRSWAKLLEETDAAELLNETLEEEKSADETLTDIAESVANVGEASEEGEEQRKK